jgi:hypothetical protein
MRRDAGLLSWPTCPLRHGERGAGQSKLGEDTALTIFLVRLISLGVQCSVESVKVERPRGS